MCLQTTPAAVSKGTRAAVFLGVTDAEGVKIGLWLC
jgi:hypothetical protein